MKELEYSIKCKNKVVKDLMMKIEELEKTSLVYKQTYDYNCSKSFIDKVIDYCEANWKLSSFLDEQEIKNAEYLEAKIKHDEFEMELFLEELVDDDEGKGVKKQKKTCIEFNPIKIEKHHESYSFLTSYLEDPEN